MYSREPAIRLRIASLSGGGKLWTGFNFRINARRHPGSLACSCGAGMRVVKDVLTPDFWFRNGSFPSGVLQSVTKPIHLETQVHDALAALPGWIQAAQGVQYDQQEYLSSLSSASTPLPVPQQGSSSNGCGSWPGAARLALSDLGEPGSQHPTQSPEAPVAASTPATARTAADLPAQHAPFGAALDSCASETDTAAACGWFSKCRGCCQLTAGEVELQAQVVPLCRGCACTLHRRSPAEQEHMVHRIMRAHAALCQRETGSSG
jgi:hypothetical protein